MSPETIRTSSVQRTGRGPSKRLSHALSLVILAAGTVTPLLGQERWGWGAGNTPAQSGHSAPRSAPGKSSGVSGHSTGASPKAVARKAPAGDPAHRAASGQDQVMRGTARLGLPIRLNWAAASQPVRLNWSAGNPSAHSPSRESVHQLAQQPNHSAPAGQTSHDAGAGVMPVPPHNQDTPAHGAQSIVLHGAPRDDAHATEVGRDTADSAHTAAGHGDGHGAFTSDRSDFTDSPEVVGRGVVQLEIGGGLEKATHHDETERVFGAPFTMLRFGVARFAEARLATRGYLWERVSVLDHGKAHHERSTGRADAELSLKLKALSQARAGVNVAIVPSLTIPWGAKHFSSGVHDPGVTVAMSRHLSSAVGVIVNAGIARSRDHGHPFSRKTFAAGLEHRMIPGFGSYVELLGATPRDWVHANEWTEWTAGLGLTRRLGNVAEVDIQGSKGLSEAAPQWGAGFGLTLRYGTGQ